VSEAVLLYDFSTKELLESLHALQSTQARLIEVGERARAGGGRTTTGEHVGELARWIVVAPHEGDIDIGPVTNDHRLQGA